VFDVDGTRQVARQRALPHTSDLPPAHRRMDLVCAPVARILFRLDGQYGDFAVVTDLAKSGLCFVTRGGELHLLSLIEMYKS
jgi:hypothetical protein